MSNEFFHPIRVYMEDTDIGGVVYYANYLKFIERARTEYLRHLGYEFQELADQSCIFVVHSCQLEYKLPSTIDDELLVGTQIAKVGRVYVDFQQRVIRKDSQQLLCSASIRVAAIDKVTLSPIGLPAGVKQAFTNARANVSATG